MRLHEVVHGRRMYSVDSERYGCVTKQLTTFIGFTNVSISLVDNEAFKKLTQVLDSCYEMPGCTKIGKEIDVIMIKLKEVMCSYFQRARLVNICTDIWTKQGMTSSFLGITAHFYSTKDSQKHNVTLAIRRFPSPHSASKLGDLLQKILDEWKIPDVMIHRVLTDKGNMIAAFKEQVISDVNCQCSFN